jgi:hypothetical protein
MRLLRPVFAAAIGVSLAGPAAATTLKREPAMGNLKPGQRVLVDDGSCPKGQIREVIGGDHVKVGGRGQVGASAVASRGRSVAPRAGFEPATNRLTAGCSTTELPGNTARV